MRAEGNQINPPVFRSGLCQTGREARVQDGIYSQAEVGLLVSPGVGEAEGSEGTAASHSYFCYILCSIVLKIQEGDGLPSSFFSVCGRIR